MVGIGLEADGLNYYGPVVHIAVSLQDYRLTVSLPVYITRLTSVMVPNVTFAMATGLKEAGRACVQMAWRHLRTVGGGERYSKNKNILFRHKRDSSKAVW